MKIKKVALITPPYHSGVVESAGTWLNLGFVYIAGALREAGYEVDYYDAMSLWHKWPDIMKRIESFKPDVVATTAYTASIVDGQLLLQMAKSINPEIITVIGNVHPTFCYEELLEKPDSGIDFVVRHEGERTLVNLLSCLKANDDPIKVKGVAFARDGGVIATPPAPFITDLDSLPTAWDLVEWPIYSYRPKKGSTLAIVSSSRGCLHNCSFCSQKLFWDRKWRARSAEHFVSELEMLNSRYGVNVAMLSDELPTRDRKRWVQILDLISERQPGVKLLMETRVNDILRDEDIMDKYVKAGIEHIYVGVESTSQKTLNLFNKGTKIEQSKRAIDIINRADIVSETSFVLGMPDDTSEGIENIVELAKHYNPDMAFFLAISPWPYADLYPHLEKYVATKDYRKYNLVDPVIKPKNMTLKELEDDLGKASMKFFMHKFTNLHKLSSWKQKFMLEVFHLLINHSYLADKMKAMAREGKNMPPEVRAILKQFGNMEKGPHPAIAPIP